MILRLLVLGPYLSSKPVDFGFSPDGLLMFGVGFGVGWGLSHPSTVGIPSALSIQIPAHQIPGVPKITVTARPSPRVQMLLWRAML